MTRRTRMPHGATVDLDCDRCGGSGEYCASCGNTSDQCNELGICEKFESRPCPCVIHESRVHSGTAIVYDAGDLEDLRYRVGEWARRNFGHTLPEKDKQIYGMLRSAAGMSEELSELIENSDQLTTCPQDIPEALDAIADICIYTLDLLWTAEIRMQEVLLFDREPSRWEKEFLEVNAVGEASVMIIHVGLAVLIGKMQHSILKQSQQIRGHEDHWDQIKMCMCHVWRLLYRLSAFWRKDLNELVKETATHVLKRDWLSNPDHAHEIDNANR